MEPVTVATGTLLIAGMSLADVAKITLSLIRFLKPVAGKVKKFVGAPELQESLAAAHLRLITDAFLVATNRHWGVAPDAKRENWFRRLKARLEGEPAQEWEAAIKKRLVVADLKTDCPGEVEGTEELALIADLIGAPERTRYFQMLKDAFLWDGGDNEPLLVFEPDENPFRFGQHFLLAYGEALSRPEGKSVRDYLGTLESIPPVKPCRARLHRLRYWPGGKDSPAWAPALIGVTRRRPRAAARRAGFAASPPPNA